MILKLPRRPLERAPNQDCFALRRYTAVETLAGDNAYCCEACARKVRAQRRLAFEVAPNALQLCLKRFASVRTRAPHLHGQSRSAAAGP